MTGIFSNVTLVAVGIFSLQPEDRAPPVENLSQENKMSFWTILFIILLIAWIFGFSIFHVAGGLIHLLLVFAVIALILHFVLGRRAV